MEELFPLVNEQGDLIGKATRTLCHSGSFLLHPVVHLHVFNAAGQLFLQKRSLLKDIQPGMWDTSVGGHVDYEETLGHPLAASIGNEIPAESIAAATATVSIGDALTIPPWVLTALQREAREELGIVCFEPIFVLRYSFRSAYECELVHTFFTIHNGPIEIDPLEISEGRFWDRSDVLANLGKGVFTPNFEGEVIRVLEAFEAR